MLLGDDDFRTLMGNPRGKQMLHSAWLHRPGVLWGYDVCVEGVFTLKVAPGLAIDPLGRELITEASECLNVRDWLARQDQGYDNDTAKCRTRTVKACLVATFDCCQTNPVPTLADPCDTTRKHDDYSRVVERARIELRLGSCPVVVQPYHRVRVLLGLDEAVGPAGDEALAARRRVARTQPDRRVAALLRQFRALAARDVAGLHPAREQGDAYSPWFPSDDVAVVLARIEIDIRDTDGSGEIDQVRSDVTARTVLLPTSTIQELTCGLAAGVISPESAADAGGPRVTSARWADDGRVLEIHVDTELEQASLRRAIQITSLSPRGWVDEGDNIDSVLYVPGDGGDPKIVIEMADRPIHEVVRVIVRGTGPFPVLGADPPVPLAGRQAVIPVQPTMATTPS